MQILSTKGQAATTVAVQTKHAGLNSQVDDPPSCRQRFKHEFLRRNTCFGSVYQGNTEYIQLFQNK